MSAELLQILDAKDLHVHEMPDNSEERRPIYRSNFEYRDTVYPSIHSIETHYLMHGSDVVHIGNTLTIQTFARNFKTP